MNTLAEFKAAVSTLKVVDPSTRLGVIAAGMVRNLGPRQVVVQVPCILCDRSFPHTTTVTQAAEWTDSPRGMCGRH